MEAECPVDDPQRLRGWLIAKALEAVSSLQEALELAAEAEAFLCNAPYPAKSGNNRAVAGGDAVKPTAVPLPGVTKAESAHETLADPLLADSLTVLAPRDDVVRYLQRTQTVLSAEHDCYLIDGQLCETADQLVERANRMRRSEKLPCFTLTPAAGSERTRKNNHPAASRTIGTTRAPRALAETDEIGQPGTRPVVAPWRGCDAYGRPLTGDHPRFS